ncbi:MAG TPA: NUDIX hydrolase [Bacillus sp. (in: firmicutes)]|uniref:NUDIX domain-containing protein n=1 Tax=Bacillus litorisediminis TaxID=2922713 RepID=UPI001FAB97BD|nr:NUDIX hydrolase [Bacillus litorisediminis]HWO75788.1 NUDIX hydrolase [Bacillus sp. (in: firmicutes)]
MSEKFNEKTIHRDEIFRGRIITLQVDEVELPNGKTSKRELIRHPGAVAVIPILENGKILMVEQFRKPLERTIVEIPAGKLEPNEEPELTAKRELEEETGYQCESLEHLISFYTSPGFADELIHVYVATGLSKAENPLPADEDEFVNILEVSLSEAEQMIESKQIYDAKTAYAILYLKLKELMKK